MNMCVAALQLDLSQNLFLHSKQMNRNRELNPKHEGGTAPAIFCCILGKGCFYSTFYTYIQFIAYITYTAFIL